MVMGQNVEARGCGLSRRLRHLDAMSWLLTCPVQRLKAEPQIPLQAAVVVGAAAKVGPFMQQHVALGVPLQGVGMYAELPGRLHGGQPWGLVEGVLALGLVHGTACNCR